MKKRLLFLLFFATGFISYAQTFTTQPTDQVSCNSATVTFSVTTAALANFNWQFSTDGGTSWDNLPEDSFFSGTSKSDAVSSTLTVTGPSAIHDGYKIRCSINLDPYYSDIVTLSVIQVSASVGTDDISCDGTYTLTGDNPSPATGLWTTPGAGIIATPTAYNSFVENMNTGTNEFIWTVTQGVCSDVKTLIIDNNEFTTDADLGTDPNQIEVCSNAIMLNAESAGTGSGNWAIVAGAGGTIANQNLHNTTVTNLYPGQTTFQWTVTRDGCMVSDQVVVNNNEVVAQAGSDQEVAVSTATLAASPPTLPATGYWSVVSSTGIVLNTSASVSQVTGLNIGTNEFKWTVTKGSCEATDNVVVNYTPIAVDAGTDFDYCGEQVFLNGNNPMVGSGVWAVVSGTATIANPTVYNSEIMVDTQTSAVLRWTITAPGGSNFDEVTVTNNEILTGESVPTNICSNTTTLSAETLPPGGTGEWLTYIGTGTIVSQSSQTTTVNNIGAGSNVFRWEITDGSCYNLIEYEINNNAVTANAGSDKTIEFHTTNLSADLGGGETGYWSLVSGGGVFSNSSLQTSNVSSLHPGPNVFLWTVQNSYGCTASDNVTLTYDYPTANAGNDFEVCGSDFNLNATAPPAGFTGSWSLVSGTANIEDNNNATSTVLSMPAQTTATFRWTVFDGVNASADDVVVTNNQVVVGSSSAFFTCSSTATLDGETPPAGGTGTWSVVFGTGSIVSPSSQTTTVNNIGLGSNSYRWSIADGSCNNFIDYEVVNNAASTNAGPDQNVAVNNATLNADPLQTEETGSWSVVSGGGVLSSPSLNSTSVSGLLSGPNVFRWTFTNIYGCTTSDDVTISYNLPSANAGNDFEVCGSDFSLNATAPPAGFTGSWSLVSGMASIVSTANANTAVTAMPSQTTATFRWTITDGTDYTADDVVVTNNYVTAFAGNDQSVCGTNATLDATAPSFGTGGWILVSGQAGITSGTTPNSSVTGLGLGSNVLEWKVVDGTCSATDQVVISNNAVQQANAGADIRLVYGGAIPMKTSYQLNAVPPVAPASGYWSSATAGITFENASTHYATVNGLISGENILQWTVVNKNCQSTDELILRNEELVVDAGPNIEVCANEAQMAALDPVSFSGVWSLESGSGTILEPSNYQTTITNLSLGENVFKWTVDNGVDVVSDLVTVLNNQIVADAGPDTAYWTNGQTNPNSALTLYANQPDANATGYWQTVSAGITFSNASTANAQALKIPTGWSKLVWTVQKGVCEATDTLKIFNRITFYNKPGVTGNWNDPLVWQPEFIPTIWDSVVVNDGTINVSGIVAEFYSINIESGLLSVFGTAKGAASLRGGSVVIEQDIEKGTKAVAPTLRVSNGGSVVIEQDIEKGAKANSGLRIGNGGSVVIEQDIEKYNIKGLANLTVKGSVVIEQDIEKGSKGGAGLRIGNGGSVVIEQDIEKSSKAENKLRIGSGGSVVIEQDIEKATGSAELILRSGVDLYIGAPTSSLTKATAPTLTIGNNGSVVIEQDIEKNSKAINPRITVGSNGSVVIEQDIEKAVASVTVRGGGSVVIEQDIEKAPTGNGGSMRIKGGSVVIEQDIEKNTKAVKGTLVVSRGGSVVIEQDIEKNGKLGLDSYIDAPKVRISGGSVQIGTTSKTFKGKGPTTKLSSGHIVIEQDIEKADATDQPSLVVGAGGALNFYDIADQREGYLELGTNAAVTFSDDATMVVPVTATLPSMVVEETASLIDETPEGSVVNNAFIQVKQTFALGEKLISPPLQQLTTALFANVGFSGWNEATRSWSQLITPFELTPITGYRVLSNIIDTIFYQGSIYSGEFTKTLTNTEQTNMNNQGWNLVGNPFTSAIDWELLSNSGLDAAFYTYNTTKQTFGVYLAGGHSINGADQFINVAEAVFVKAAAGASNPTIGATNKSKVHLINGLYTPKAKLDIADGLKLTVSGQNYTDQAIVQFNSTATDDFDNGLDAYKLKSLNPKVPQLYVVPAVNAIDEINNELAISTMPYPEAQKFIPVHFTTGLSGEYTISATEFNMGTEHKVILSDLKQNQHLDLSSGQSLTFSASATDDPYRFVLMFAKSATGFDDDDTILPVQVYTYGNNLFIRSDLGTDYNIELYNTVGQRVWQTNSNGQLMRQIPLSFPNGVYLVKLTAGEQAYSKKIIVK